MTQEETILARLRAGETITPRDAFLRHGWLAMHSVAASLRAKGHNVVCELQTNGKQRWGAYSIPAPSVRVRAVISDDDVLAA